MHPLASLLSSEAQSIVGRWQELRDAGPEPGRVSDLAARIPRLLGALAAALARADDEPFEEDEFHHRLGFELASVMREHDVLRTTVFEIFEKSAGTLGFREFRIVTDFFARELTRAVAQYSARQKAIQEAQLAVFSETPVVIANLEGPVQDITEQRRLREAHDHQRDEAENMLRRFINNLPELAWSAQPDGSIDFYNQRWYDYTGTTFEEMRGWGWDKVHDAEHLPRVVAAWKRSLKTGEDFEMEFPLRRFDGEFRWFLTRVRPVKDGSGKIVRWFGMNADIHDKREATRKLEEANLAKDEFLATASHELRTPLTAILGWARMLRSGQLGASDYARGLASIERNASAQVQLIEDILDGSRIITGNLQLEIRPLDLTALVHAAVDAVRLEADAKGITLQLELDPAAARVVGDPDRLQQVIWNLASNAVKFTPKGGRIDVRLARVGTSIELSVSDSGQGISAEFLPHVFERFRQAEGSTTRRHGGLGLGLALVHHLVEAHGGGVRAESAGAQRGARFIVTLPVQAVYAESPEGPRAIPTPGPTARAGLLNGVSVLVVDDEADARELVATVLLTAGADVVVAKSALDALDIVQRGGAMVMISDIGMPVIDGYELMRRIRALPGARNRLPAAALTAYSREQDRRLAMEAGFQAHVSKPIEPAELVRVVLNLVDLDVLNLVDFEKC